ncbi:FusB/FusC family EF-G-binding protein [Salimicrobium flavidum]|uniref:Fibronectin-binding protein (FBP), N-terminal n=1 Tax=Salimicrobium flavidum TaxID=570947 RepID=A0A1N7JIE6_9BACI|nr:FusB/FusC family EF-G-binding protein [Salimicrobium flavidum]SIS49034.1 Fibronectin-binding protein (FBP), N-terminal [Salimicrobium flavidum]
MEPFIRSDQYHYIKQQVRHIVQTSALINDQEMVQTIQDLGKDKMMEVFHELTDLERRILEGITKLEDRTDAEMYEARILPLVHPFEMPAEEEVRELFPYLTKVKPPLLGANVDERDLTYLSWFDAGLDRKFIVTYRNGELVGMEGSFTYSGQKNLCSICREHEHVGLFVTDVTEYKRRGNYVCKDSVTCNRNITDQRHLYKFMDNMKR